MILRDPKDYPTDMTELLKALDAAKISYTIKKHPIADSKSLLGYNPAGDWQVMIEDQVSVIRGMASFGYYEVMRTKGAGRWSQDPERFGSPTALVKDYIAFSKPRPKLPAGFFYSAR